ncbi:hypothetical protein MJO28_001262 [Puccinia striiformis f. sp. tritici]|uniref:Glutathione S-transferase n=3 Tax=Puccinia striiformis TaxID=27350 RepID=A0A0L0URH4_9BASI|nr:hypothetical protein Pst134EA_003484 [Puccinia striiformis f. sp. tritici]XP_047812349.1 hypothetical protein Pst134EA_003494 [Puccinia striiformis f. sp. tritici]KAI9611691.1 hypothetical protein H4Q26_008646 [Puccinia striiformis f. sp. tritici PST-130]KNE89683.1 hypothetical protein PSTG_16846 [Puccinia striiformis f. sp. tritici PST-78]POW02252.1 hypothetical protein PSTT_12005 [Puccinia striiformis]KAH9465068.1 hypothetical protein Pst134EB_004556 [Puccinia striiformis f. sp. tritici]
MPSYKLTYFDIKGGRGDSIRLALHHGGIPFTYERLSFEQFGKVKDSMPFGQLPVLTVDDKNAIPQEGAILRYVGRLTGAYSNDKEKALSQDIMLGFGDDMYTTASAFFGPEHPGKETLKKLSIEERIPKTFGNLDKYLAKKGTTFSAGNELSVADFKLYTIITLFKSGMLHGLSADIVEKYPHVSKLYQAIDTHETVTSWKENEAK